VSYEGSTLTLGEIRTVVTEVLDSYYNELLDFLRRMFREKDLHIDQVLSEVINTKLAVNALGDVAPAIRDVNTSISVAVQEMRDIENALKDLDSHLPAYYDRLASKIAESMVARAGELWSKYWETAPPYVKWFYKAQLNYFAGVWGIQVPKEVLTDDPLGNPIEDILEWLKKIAEALAKIPEFVDSFIDYVIGFFDEAWDALVGIPKWLWGEIRYFASSPWAWFRDRVAEPILSGLSWLEQKVWLGFEFFLDKVVGISKWLFSKIAEIVSDVFEAIRSVAVLIWSVISKSTDWAWSAFISPVMRVLVDGLPGVLRGAYREALASGGGKGEVFVFMTVNDFLLRQFLYMSAPFYFMSNSMSYIKEVEKEVSAKVAGAGVAGKFKLAIGELIKWLGEAGKDVSRNLLTGTAIGMGFSIFSPLNILTRPIAKSFFTPVFMETIGTDAFFELPSDVKVEEFLRRALPYKILLELGGSLSGDKVVIRDATGKESVRFKPFIKWEEAKTYVSNLMKVYGLPDKFLEVYRLGDKDFYLEFIDRFGNLRVLPLSPVYEMPTHSEMLKMTQKDIFPGVDITQSVAALRGWAPDITVMSYLLTFKYPSFEKLWQFYMRAISGMLWFYLAPNNEVRRVFTQEAKSIKAGVPITPYEIQRALEAKLARGVDAFEVALNTYLKWLEYSNFSWFTENTEMYGVKVGEKVVGELGGWAADSWIMVDVAADIPGKIDMRWMSRYGIFDLMARRFEDKKIPFEGFTPMVDAVKHLLDPAPASGIQTSLKWFSKLLQATGLHPAWVPVTTVAENIMVISDEMTLLRTGWINMFKEGLLDFERMERSLRGIITVSYEVGYFDTVSKVWRSGWINLPVRWLPHERRLLALRALMDRALDLYREYYGALKRLAGKNVISPDRFEEELRAFVRVINDTFYVKTLAGILGVDERDVPREMLPSLEQAYIDAWKFYVKRLWEEEQVDRARLYLRYLVMRLVERTAQGLVTQEEFDRVLSMLRDVARITDKEVELIKGSVGYLRDYYVRSLRFDALINKYRRMRIGREELSKKLAEIGVAEHIIEDIVEKHVKTYVPSLSQIASIAEVVPEVTSLKFGDKPYHLYVIDWFDLSDVEKSIWRLYIERKPYKGDVDKVVGNIRALLGYGVSTELLNKVLGRDVRSWLAGYGVDEVEWELIMLQASTDAYERVWREAYLSVSRLASMAELVPEALDWLVEHLSKHGVPEDVIEKWRRYVRLREISSEVGLLRSRFVELASKGATEEVVLKALGVESVDKLAEYGISRAEWQVLLKVGGVERVKDVWGKFSLTPDVMLGHVELMPDNIDAIAKALEEAGLPKSTVDYWRTYMFRKLVSGDFGYVRTAFRNLLEKGVDIGQYDWNAIYEEGKKMYEKVAGFLSKFGVTQEEFALWYVSAFPEAIAPREVNIGFIATLSEYVAIPDAWVVEVLKRFKIPDKWHPLVLSYIKSKPLRDELLRLRSSLVKAWVKGVDLGKYGEDALTLLRAYGWTDKEIEILRLASNLERIIEEQVERWPSVSEIITIAEYVPEARKFLDRVFEARKVPPELRPYYRKYAQIKPWYDELRAVIREVITDYSMGLISDEDMKGFLEWLKQFGFEEEEIRFIYTVAAIRKRRREMREARRSGGAGGATQATQVTFVW